MKYLKFPIRFIFYYILGLIGILAVSIAPEVFRERGLYNVVGYLEEFIKFIFVFMDGDNWSYSYKGITVDFLDMLWGPYLYSLQIIGGALGIGLGIAFILTVFTVFLPRPITSALKKVLNLLETVPDLMFAFMLQLDDCLCI